MSATLHLPGAGERHATGEGSEVVVKAGGPEAGGTLFLSETVIAPGFPGPPLHRHAALHDMFYVLEGTLAVRLEGERRELSPGTFLCVPPGVSHTFSNPGDAPVRFLNFNTPSGFEQYMRELGEAARRGPLTSEAIGAVALRHDVEVVEDPAAG